MLDTKKDQGDRVEDASGQGKPRRGTKVHGRNLGKVPPAIRWNTVADEIPSKEIKAGLFALFPGVGETRLKNVVFLPSGFEVTFGARGGFLGRCEIRSVGA